MAMNQIRGLLSIELAATYDGEQRLLPMLAQQAREATSGEAHAFFATARLEAEHHIEIIRGCFALLGEPVPVRTNHAVAGLAHERDAFLLLDPAPDLLLVHGLATALKVGHLAIASYAELVRLAHLVAEARVAMLLSESLRGQRRAAARAERLLEVLVRPGAGSITPFPESVPIPRAVEPDVRRPPTDAPAPPDRPGPPPPRPR
jgi:ferritin-like metal-binding protein YciE